MVRGEIPLTGGKGLRKMGKTFIIRQGSDKVILGPASSNASLLLGAGVSTNRMTTSDANSKFIEFRLENSATSGDNRGIYNRFYMTGAGGGGESLRSFTTVEDVAGGTAHGAHISLNFGSTGSVTGLGVASRNTLHIANQAYTGLGGTYAATQAEIWSDGASSDPVGMTELSFLRCVNGGNANGIADVDDDAHLITYDGGSIASGNVVQTANDTTVSHGIKVKMNGTVMYLLCNTTLA